MGRERCWKLGWTAAALLVWTLPASAPAQHDPRLVEVQALLDQGASDRALAQLDQLLRGDRKNAEALLLRSMARIMEGQTREGIADLERALEVDPELRQGWLNLGGLRIAEGQLDAAWEALSRAQELDPTDLENHLNLGAVQVLRGESDAAREHFARYLTAHPESAEARFLVAANWALGGHEEEAVARLAEAVAIDERWRLKARSDERFLGLTSAAYRQLLSTDSWTPAADARTAAAAFETPYRRTDPQLVWAVLEALKDGGIEYDPSIEATDAWALVWGTMRVKIYTQEDGHGVVSLSADPSRFTADEWARRTQELFRAVYDNLRASGRLYPPKR